MRTHPGDRTFHDGLRRLRKTPLRQARLILPSTGTCTRTCTPDVVDRAADVLSSPPDSVAD